MQRRDGCPLSSHLTVVFASKRKALDALETFRGLDTNGSIVLRSIAVVYFDETKCFVVTKEPTSEGIRVTARIVRTFAGSKAAAELERTLAAGGGAIVAEIVEKQPDALERAVADLGGHIHRQAMRTANHELFELDG